MPLKNLNAQQKEAATHTTGPLLIVAGAGTGKTTVITERVAWLIENKLAQADEILALTFTDKAAGEMEERVDRLLPYGYVDLWVMTFHSFCERILKQHGLDIGLANDFKLLNTTEQWLMVRQNLEKFNLDYYRPLGNPTKFIHALIKHFSRCKDEEIWPADYLAYAEKNKTNQDRMEALGGEGASLDVRQINEVANAYHTYQQLLLDSNALDFGDLINYTLKLFRQRPQILKIYQNKFKYVLVDEFQDTNWAQYELIKLLVAQHSNLTVVGDDDQSIYKFRGASVSNILQFKDDFSQAKEIYLNNNYRSSQNILDLAYNFIQLNNPERLEVKLAQEQKSTRRQVQGKQKHLSKKLIAVTKEKGVVEHLHFMNEGQEVAGVVNKIIELKSKDKDSNWNDFVILVRANHQAEPFLNGLRLATIPFNFVASKGLYSKEIVIDILAYLKLLDNYHESLALWRVLNWPMVALKTEDLMQINNFARRKAISLFEACQQINVLTNVEVETRRKVNKVLGLLAQHSQLIKSRTVKAMVLEFLKDYGYQQYLLAQNDEKSLIYIRQLIDKMDEFEKSFVDKSVKNFMGLMDLEIESGEQGDLSKELEEGPEAVKVMTIHSAKGLEFKYVFIVNLVDKRFPAMDRREQIELPGELVKEIVPAGDVHLPEERRLFYVAATRAKRGLYFTSADDYGGARKKKLSRFLYETNITKNTEAQKHRSTEEYKAVPVSAKELSTNKYVLPAAFSFSQLKAYETCPYQYYLNFILRVPVEGKAVFSYGKTMHATLYKFFVQLAEQKDLSQSDLFGGMMTNTKTPKTGSTKKIKLPELDELLKIYQIEWQDDWYEDKKQKETYRRQGAESLKDFYKQLVANGTPQVLALEKDFNLKIGQYTLRGRIDRVDQKNNQQVEIVDYKTGAAKNEDGVEKDQLLIYQMAGQEVFGWEIEKLTFYYLDNNSTVSFLGKTEEIQQQKDKILKLIEKMKTGNFTATPSQFKCKYCDFNSICKYRQL